MGDYHIKQTDRSRKHLIFVDQDGDIYYHIKKMPGISLAYALYDSHEERMLAKVKYSQKMLKAGFKITTPEGELLLRVADSLLHGY